MTERQLRAQIAARRQIMSDMEAVQYAQNAVIAVPADAVDELEVRDLAFPLPIMRGPAVDAVVTVGMDSAALVTLLQTPDAIQAFATWLRRRCRRAGNSIELTAKRGDKRVKLTVEGDVDVRLVADFLTAAFADVD